MLTKALENKEHPGQTRGLGPNYPWRIGFPEDEASYRSRERGKKRKEHESADRLQNMETKYDELLGMFKAVQQQLDEMRSS